MYIRTWDTGLGLARTQGDRGLYSKASRTAEEQAAVEADVARNKRSLIDAGMVDPVTGERTIISQQHDIYWSKGAEAARNFALENADAMSQYESGRKLVEAARAEINRGLPPGALTGMTGGFLSGTIFGVPKKLVAGAGAAVGLVLLYKFFAK